MSEIITVHCRLINRILQITMGSIVNNYCRPRLEVGATYRGSLYSCGGTGLVQASEVEQGGGDWHQEAAAVEVVIVEVVKVCVF